MLKSAGIVPVVIPDFRERYEAMMAGKKIDRPLVESPSQQQLSDEEHQLLDDARQILRVLGHDMGSNWHGWSGDEAQCALCAVHEALYDVLVGGGWGGHRELVTHWLEKLEAAGGKVDLDLAYGTAPVDEIAAARKMKVPCKG